MKQAEQIEHKGTILSIEEGVVRVAIEVMEACGSCASRKACAMGQTSQREIAIYADEADRYAVGEVVSVAARRSMGAMAVLLCYVIPLVVLILALALSISSGLAEGVSAVITLCVLALYYGVLAMFRNKIARKVVFTINKI